MTWRGWELVGISMSHPRLFLSDLAAMPLSAGLWNPAGIAATYYADTADGSVQDPDGIEDAAVDEFLTHDPRSPITLQPLIGSGNEADAHAGIGLAASSSGSGSPRRTVLGPMPPLPDPLMMAPPSALGNTGRSAGRGPTPADFFSSLPQEFPSGVKGGPTSFRFHGEATIERLIALLRSEPRFASIMRNFVNQKQSLMSPCSNFAVLQHLLDTGVEAAKRIEPASPPKPQNAAEKAILAVLQERHDFRERVDALRRQPHDGPIQDFTAESDVELHDRDVVAQAHYAGGGGTGFGMQLGTSVRDMNVSVLRDDLAMGLAIFLGAADRVPGFMFDKKGPDGSSRLVLIHVLEARPREFDRMKLAVIQSGNIILGMDLPIDIERVADLFADNDRGLSVQLLKQQEQNVAAVVKAGDNSLVQVMRKGIVIPYDKLLSDPTHLIRAINLATRILEAVHQDRLYAEDFKIIEMTQRRPVLDALMGMDESREFSRLEETIWEGMTSRGGKGTRFTETQTSLKQREEAKRTRRPDPPLILRVNSERVRYPSVVQKYILVTQSKPAKLLMDIEMRFDADAARKMIGKKGLNLQIVDDRTEPLHYRGGRRDIRKSIWHVRETTGSQTRDLMTFDSGSVKIAFATRAELHRSLAVLDQLYAAGVFTTATENVQGIRAGLTEVELSLMPVVDLLISLYEIFIKLEIEKRNFVMAGRLRTKTANAPDAATWLTAIIREVRPDPENPRPLMERRMLHVLKKVAEEIDPMHPSMKNSYAQEKHYHMEQAIRVLEAAGKSESSAS